MSSKVEKPGLVPRLRFPEFRDAGEWTPRELGPLATKVGSGITPTGGDKNYTREGRPFVRSQNVGWGELILNDVAFIDEETHQSFNSTEIKVSDVLLNITGASIGRSAVADSRIIGGNVNQHVCIIRAKQDELNPFLLNQILISDFGQKQIDSFQAGGNRQGLNFAQIRSFIIPLPPNAIEQSKIADCLASIDELITLEAQKLDTLKTHKKGLMQQLFPAEGETLPRLRFPEFRYAGEWVEEPLGKLSSYENGKAYEQDITENGKYIVVNSRFISSNGTVQKYTNAKYLIAKAGDVLMVLSDLPKGKALAKCYFVEVNDRYAVNQRVCRLQADRVDAKFLFYILNRNPYLLALDDGLSQTHLSKGSVLECPLCVPQKREEQQRIANCLATLDDLIAAQTQKIAALKTHKKSLMQQLFPVMENTP